MNYPSLVRLFIERNIYSMDDFCTFCNHNQKIEQKILIFSYYHVPIPKTRIFWAIHEKPEKVGGALWEGGPTLLGRPAGFSIRKALGESENNFYKIIDLSYTNKFFFEMQQIFFLI